MRRRSSGFKIGFALAAIAFASPASAGLLEMQQERRQQTDDCKPDAMKYCGDYVPDVDAITACMQRNVKRLAPVCRKYFRRA